MKKIYALLLIAISVLCVVNTDHAVRPIPTDINYDRMSDLNLRFIEGILFFFYFLSLLGLVFFTLHEKKFKWTLFIFLGGLLHISSLVNMGSHIFFVISHASTLIFFIATHYQLVRLGEQEK